MVSILDQYEPMYFQIATFNLFHGSKLKILVSLTQDFYKKWSNAQLPTKKNFRDARGLAPYRQGKHLPSNITCLVVDIRNPSSWI